MTSSPGVQLQQHASDEQYAEAMHSILSSEPCRGLVTEPTRLLAHVFIGSQSNAEDLTTMRRLGISHVLNCAGYKGPRPSPNASPYDGFGIEYYEFKAEDSDRYDITRHFTEAFRFLDAAKRAGGVALVHCALGINRSAAVCVAYIMVDRRQPLLAVTRLIKDRRRIVLANKAFQRQLVAFARSRGLLGELPKDRDDDDDDDRLSRTVHRVQSLNDRVPDGVDWRLNGLAFDLVHRRLPVTYTRFREEWGSAGEDWRPYSSRRSDDVPPRASKAHDNTVQSTSSRTASSEFTPQRRMLPLPSRSREIDDVTPSWVSPRQYRSSKSATSLVPVPHSGTGSLGRPTRTAASALVDSHSRASSASRFSLGFL